MIRSIIVRLITVILSACIIACGGSKCYWCYDIYKNDVALTPEASFPIPPSHQAVLPPSWDENGNEITPVDEELFNEQLRKTLIG